ncbi:MAG: site-specific integrase [Saprospiraceae bacterium]|nr:site-specific integrase [Saprospiraceae bacterium]
MKDYLPARLVKGVSWYIVFYAWDPATGQRERFRQSFDLNRIKSPKDRMAKARLIIADINKKLPSGYPFNEGAEQQKMLQTPILNAMDKAVQIKCHGARRSTSHSYHSITDIFVRYLKDQGMDQMPVNAFTKSDSIIFLDEMDKKGISARTHNNYTRTLKGMFNALLDRQFIAVNPWMGIKREQESDKKRRSITRHEAQVIIRAAKEEDPQLYLGIILQYHCFIRPNELRHILVRHFDLQVGVIRIPGSISKNKRDAIITIPHQLVPIMEDRLKKMGRHWYLFGKKGNPGPDGPVGANTMGQRHKMLIRSLRDRGSLPDIEGISYYSWKDTGATALIQAGIPIDEVMKQLRHTDLATTQVYIQNLHRVNEKIRDLDSLLL